MVGAASCVPPVGPDPATLGPSGDGQVGRVHLSGAYTYATSGSPQGSNLQVTRGRRRGGDRGLREPVSFPGAAPTSSTPHPRPHHRHGARAGLGLGRTGRPGGRPSGALRGAGLAGTPRRIRSRARSDWFRAWKFIEFRPFRLAWSVSDGTVAAPGAAGRAGSVIWFAPSDHLQRGRPPRADRAGDCPQRTARCSSARC